MGGERVVRRERRPDHGVDTGDEIGHRAERAEDDQLAAEDARAARPIVERARRLVDPDHRPPLSGGLLGGVVTPVPAQRPLGILFRLVPQSVEVEPRTGRRRREPVSAV